MSNLSNRCMRHALFTTRRGDSIWSRFRLHTEICPRVSTLLSSTTLLRLGFLSQMAEVCREPSSNGKLCNGSSSQVSRNVEHFVQLLLHTLLMRCYRHSHERGTGRGKQCSVVLSKRQMGCHCYPRPRNNAIHRRKAVVLRVETVQETQQIRRGRAARNPNGYHDNFLE